MSLDVNAVRADFPFLVAHPERVYLDSGATSQSPQRVIDAQAQFAASDYAAVHRGSSVATGSATTAFETARFQVASLVGANADDIVWTENATDALNMVSLGMADASAGLGGERFALAQGDEIVITQAEHHANLIPWQRLAKRTGATLKWVEVDDRGLWSADDLAPKLSKNTRVVAFAHVSNVTGLISNVPTLVELVRSKAPNAIIVLDATQSVPHLPVGIEALGVDFAAFSSHKALGPTGIGALWGRTELLKELPPARTGGSTITTVTMADADFLPPPHKFEAGTQPVVQAVGFGAAAQYLENLGMQNVATHEAELGQALAAAVEQTPGVTLIGPAAGQPRAGLAAFAVDGVHAHDVGQFLDDRGITVRTGHHCAQPLHRALGVTATTRASAYVYNTLDDVARFAEALAEVRPYFGEA